MDKHKSVIPGIEFSDINIEGCVWRKIAFAGKDGFAFFVDNAIGEVAELCACRQTYLSIPIRTYGQGASLAGNTMDWQVTSLETVTYIPRRDRNEVEGVRYHALRHTYDGCHASQKEKKELFHGSSVFVPQI